MRTILIFVLAATFLFVRTKEASTAIDLPGESLYSTGITLSQNGFVSVTTRLGESWCNRGELILKEPWLYWPDSSLTGQTIIENVGLEKTQTKVIGPYKAGTRLVFELIPKGFCGNIFFLSTDWFHARIDRNSTDNWTISWEDWKDGDFNDFYTDVVVTPAEIGSIPPVFIEEIITERSPFSPDPHYKLPWKFKERYQVRQTPNSEQHQGANAYDFGGTISVVAPERGMILWVEDSFGPGTSDESLRAKTNVIVLKTAPDTQITFVHLEQNSAKVRVGETVEQGQELAVSGDSGFTYGEHLHFEFQRACRSLDRAKELRVEYPEGMPTLRWACDPKSNLDGFYIEGRYYKGLGKYYWYTSDNR